MVGDIGKIPCYCILQLIGLAVSLAAPLGIYWAAGTQFTDGLSVSEISAYETTIAFTTFSILGGVIVFRLLWWAWMGSYAKDYLLRADFACDTIMHTYCFLVFGLPISAVIIVLIVIACCCSGSDKKDRSSGDNNDASNTLGAVLAGVLGA